MRVEQGRLWTWFGHWILYIQYVKWSDPRTRRNQHACWPKPVALRHMGKDFIKTRGCILNSRRYHEIPFNTWSKSRKVSFTIASKLSQIRTYYRQKTKRRRYHFNNVTRTTPSGMQPCASTGRAPVLFGRTDEKRIENQIPAMRVWKIKGQLCLKYSGRNGKPFFQILAYRFPGQISRFFQGVQKKKTGTMLSQFGLRIYSKGAPDLRFWVYKCCSFTADEIYCWEGKWH